MARMEEITFGTEVSTSTEFQEDADIQLWLKMGRMAMFFCLWMAMAIPVLLVISLRF